jgi:hypothetical protein
VTQAGGSSARNQSRERVPLVILARLAGDHSGLLESYESAVEHEWPPGLVAHVCARAGERLVIIDIWESEEDSWTFLSESGVQQLAREMSSKADEIESYEVFSLMVRDDRRPTRSTHA